MQRAKKNKKHTTKSKTEWRTTDLQTKKKRAAQQTTKYIVDKQTSKHRNNQQAKHQKNSKMNVSRAPSIIAFVCHNNGSLESDIACFFLSGSVLFLLPLSFLFLFSFFCRPILKITDHKRAFNVTSNH